MVFTTEEKKAYNNTLKNKNTLNLIKAISISYS